MIIFFLPDKFCFGFEAGFSFPLFQWRKFNFFDKEVMKTKDGGTEQPFDKLKVGIQVQFPVYLFFQLFSRNC